jgi:hypothetical protein
LAIGFGIEVTVTVSGRLEIPRLLVTTSLNTSFTMRLTGAVNVGDTAVVLLSVTAGPPVRIQLYVSGRPKGSELPVPFSVTKLPAATI